jgi:hypothetical protein
MELADFLAMDPIGQINANLTNPTALIDSTEMLCTIMMAVPDVAQGLDPVNISQLLQKAMELHLADGDVQLICTRGIGAVLEFIPKACHRVCESTPLANTFTTQLQSAAKKKLTFKRFTFDEWVEETLRLLRRMCLEGQVALQHIPGGLATVSSAVLATMENSTSQHVQSAVLKLLSDVAYRTQDLPPTVIRKLADMLSATVTAMRSAGGDPTPYYGTLRNVCDCTLSHLRTSDTETLPVAEALNFVEALFLGVELLSSMTSSADAKSHMELLLIVLAAYAHSCPLHNVPLLQKVLVSDQFNSQEVLLTAFHVAAGVAGADFERALTNPFVYLPSTGRGGGTEGQVVTQESLRPCSALSSLLYFVSALVDCNAKSASMIHFMVPQCAWYWEDDGNNFNKYDESSNTALERALRVLHSTGKPGKPVPVGGKYQADLTQMKQNGGQPRNMRRCSIPYTFIRDVDTPTRLQKNVPYDREGSAKIRDLFLTTLISISESGDPLHADWALDILEKAVLAATSGMSIEMMRTLCGFLCHLMGSNAEYVTRMVGRLSGSKADRSRYMLCLSKAGLVSNEQNTGSVDALSQRFSGWLRRTQGPPSPELFEEFATMWNDSSFLTGSELLRNNVCGVLCRLFDADPKRAPAEFARALRAQEGASTNLLNVIREALTYVVDEIQTEDKASWTAMESAVAMQKLANVSVQVVECSGPDAPPMKVPAPPPKPNSPKSKKKGASPPPTGASGILHAIGKVVEATWKGGKKYYRGHIKSVNPDGTFAIQFDDGDFEPAAVSTTIRETATAPPAPPPLTCSQGHSLSPFTSPTWRCDVCGVHPPDNHQSMACRACDFDMCAGCVQKSGVSSAPAPQQPTPGSGGQRAHFLATVADAAEYFKGKDAGNQELARICVDGVGEVPRSMTLLLAAWLACPVTPRPDPINALRVLIQMPMEKAPITPEPKKTRKVRPKKGEEATPPPAPPPPSLTPTSPILPEVEAPTPAIFSTPIKLHVIRNGKSNCTCGAHAIRPVTCTPNYPKVSLSSEQQQSLKSIQRVMELLAAEGYEVCCESLSQRLLNTSLQRCVPTALFGKYALPRWYSAFPPELLMHVLYVAHRRALLVYLCGGASKALLQSYLKANTLGKKAPIQIMKREVALLAEGTNRIVKAYTVPRGNVFEVGGDVLRRHSGLAFNLEVQYEAEDGTGQGPTSEFFSIMSKELLKNSLALWRGCEATNDPYIVVTNEGLFPNASVQSYNNFVLMGRLAGLAITERKVLEMSLNPALLNLLRQWDVISSFHEKADGVASTGPCPLLALNQIAEVDEEVHKSLLWIQDALKRPDAAASLDSLCVNFTMNGANLCPDGANISVTPANGAEYLNLVVAHVLYHGVKGHVDAFMRGLSDVIVPDFDVLRILSVKELGDMMCGTTPDIAVEDFAAWVEPSGGYTHQSREIEDLIAVWETAFKKEDRAEFLSFCTGVRKLGPGGVRAMKKLTVRPWGVVGQVTDKVLPTARACGFILNLPSYSSREVLATKLKFALWNGKGFFLS